MPWNRFITLGAPKFMPFPIEENHSFGADSVELYLQFYKSVLLNRISRRQIEYFSELIANTEL